MAPTHAAPRAAAPKEYEALRAAMARRVAFTEALEAGGDKLWPGINILHDHHAKMSLGTRRLCLTPTASAPIEYNGQRLVVHENQRDRHAVAADLDRHGLRSLDALRERLTQEVWGAAGIPPARRGEVSLEEGLERVKQRTDQAVELFAHVRWHPDVGLLERYLGEEGANAALFPRVRNGRLLRKRVSGTARSEILHVGDDGSERVADLVDLERAELGTPQDFDVHVRQALMRAVGKPSTNPTDKAVEEARATLERRIEERSNYAELTREYPKYNYEIERLRLRRIEQLLLDAPKQPSPKHGAGYQAAQVRLAGDEHDAVVVSASFAPDATQVDGVSDKFHYQLEHVAGGVSRRATPADLERLGLGSMAAVERAVDEAAIKQRGKPGLTREQALAEFEARVELVRMDGLSALMRRELPDLELLLAHHRLKHRAATSLPLAPGLELQQAWNDPPSVYATSVSNRNESQRSLLARLGIESLHDLRAPVARRLLEQAGLSGEPTPENVARARKILKAQLTKRATLVDGLGELDQAITQDLKLVVDHQTAELAGTEVVKRPRTADLIALVKDQSGVVTWQRGALRFVSSDELGHVHFDASVGDEGWRGRRNRSGERLGSAEGVFQALERNQVGNPAAMKRRTTALLLERAGFAAQGATPAQVAAARKRLARQVAGSAALLAVLRGEHEEAQLLVDVLDSQPSGAAKLPIELAKDASRTLTLHRVRSGFQLQVNGARASIADLWALDIVDGGDFDAKVHEAALRSVSVDALK